MLIKTVINFLISFLKNF